MAANLKEKTYGMPRNAVWTALCVLSLALYSEIISVSQKAGKNSTESPRVFLPQLPLRDDILCDHSTLSKPGMTMAHHHRSSLSYLCGFLHWSGCQHFIAG